jgi:hypothetical protein
LILTELPTEQERRDDVHEDTVRPFLVVGGREHVGGLTSVQVPRGQRSGADRDLRVVIAQSPARCGSLVAAERRLVILGGRLVVLGVDEH